MSPSLGSAALALQLRILILLALLASMVSAQAPKLPEKLAVPVGRLTTLAIDTGGVNVKYKVFGGELDAFREYDPDPKMIVLRLIAYSEGTAYLCAWGAKGDAPTDAAVCVITIGESPVPNGKPKDPLTKAFAAAYLAETTADKKAKFQFLQAVCEGMEAPIAASATVGDLFAKFSAAIHVQGLGFPKGEMQGVMRVLGDNLNQWVGTTPGAALDRNAAKSAFSEIAKAMRGVHP